jgi:ABC-2 type transport system permease protein
MPIFDQGYQHWQGRLSGQVTRWLPITRYGVVVGFGNRWLRIAMLGALGPPLLLAIFLVVWGLFEQKSSFFTPFLIFLENLPAELRAGPRGFRTTIWTLAFRQFFEVQLFFPMLLVLLVGPDLISQDLRFNAIPLYLSRPIRRFEYFLGKLGVIAAFLSAVTVGPVLLAFVLGYAFSLDPAVVLDTARVLAASLAYSAIVVVSAGLLMLAFSSLSRNSRYVGAMWLAFWFISSLASGVLQETVRAEWCPLVSYTNNLNRVRDALLDAGTAWDRVTSLSQVSPREIRGPLGIGPFGPGRRRGRFGEIAPVRPPRPNRENLPTAEEFDSQAAESQPRSVWAPAKYPWQWSAGVLAGLAAVSVLILATRVRGLDRLR